MIEKLPTHSVYDDPKIVKKINELVDEANRQEKNMQNILDILIKLGETLHKLLDKLGFPKDPKDKTDD